MGRGFFVPKLSIFPQFYVHLSKTNNKFITSLSNFYSSDIVPTSSKGKRLGRSLRSAIGCQAQLVETTRGVDCQKKKKKKKKFQSRNCCILQTIPMQKHTTIQLYDFFPPVTSPAQLRRTHPAFDRVWSRSNMHKLELELVWNSIFGGGKKEERFPRAVTTKKLSVGVKYDSR